MTDRASSTDSLGGDISLRISLGIPEPASRRLFSAAMRADGARVLEFVSARAMAEYFLERRRDLDSPLDTLEVDVVVLEWPGEVPLDEAVKSVRTAGFLVPLVVLAPADMRCPFDRAEARRLGLVRWLQQPVAPEDLSDLVGRIGRRKS